MLYIAVTPHGKQFPRNIIPIPSRHHLLQMVKDTIYSGKCDLADLPHNPNQANIKQLLKILDYLNDECHSKTTRREFLRFHGKRQA
ncbi:hypothetical protein CRG49_002095 [Neisseria sp. N95_16]|nr:hypothetical protein CRG49_002095 [Neisseria sp. N95_16]